MACYAHFQLLVGGALDPDRFRDGLERQRALRREVVAGRIELLEVEVLNVGAGAGETPRDTIVSPDEHAGHARQRRADDAQARRIEMRQVPYRRRGQAEVRIVGEQRLAACRALA
jgi:hypothetical protein